MRGILGVLAAGLLVMPAAPTMFGGWAVIKVEDVPAQLEAGKATQLTFTVLQHGVTPLRGLKPTVTLTPEGARRGETFAAKATGTAGQYAATITPAAPGITRIGIDANWHEARTTLMPIPVVTQVARATHDEAAFGQRLFVAKGCVTCHVKRDDAALSDWSSFSVGPELTGRTWPADWLAGKLANPAQARGGTRGEMGMPDLGLGTAEIAALVTYLNSRPMTKTSSR